MSKERISVSFSGTSLLSVAFIVLKLCNVIDWSWWWVLAPIWIPIALVIILLIIKGILNDKVCRY
jgi:hypothetical protein